jgi:hypothetical protein
MTEGSKYQYLITFSQHHLQRAFCQVITENLRDGGGGGEGSQRKKSVRKKCLQVNQESSKKNQKEAIKHAKTEKANE